MRRRTIILGLVGAVCICALPVSGYSGVCLPAGRLLTDQEIVDAGRAKAHLFGLSGEPGCCSISEHGRKGYRVSFIERVLGGERAWVRFDTPAPNRFRFDIDDPFVHVAVTNCGRVWDGIG